MQSLTAILKQAPTLSMSMAICRMAKWQFQCAENIVSIVAMYIPEIPSPLEKHIELQSFLLWKLYISVFDKVAFLTAITARNQTDHAPIQVFRAIFRFIGLRTSRAPAIHNI
ncbi:hypothetical protein HED49_03725 [Ochrobactrum daejeonense]|nr:hypothetical protein [Brucella daejeonensis]